METLTVTADHSWWGRTSRAISLSYERGRSGGDSSPFLSTAYFHVNEDGKLIIESESMMSTTHIIADDDVKFEGDGEFLIPVGYLSNVVAQTPPRAELKAEYDPDKGNVVFTTTDGEELRFVVPTFNSGTEKPRATGSFPIGEPVVKVNGADLHSAYRAGSVMAAKVDRASISGQTPLSGVGMSLTEDGIQIFSLSVSASETFISGEMTGGDDVQSSFCLTDSTITSQRIGLFNDPGCEVRVAVEPYRRVHLESGGTHLSFSMLNTGTNSVDMMSFESILGVLGKTSENTVCRAKLSASDVKSAISRCFSFDFSQEIMIQISDTSCSISALDSHGSKVVTQKTISSTEWFSDVGHKISFVPDTESLKSALAVIDKNAPMTIEIAVGEDGNPWSFLIHDDDYSADRPHNFFVAAIRR